MIEKARSLTASVVVLDLEDGVGVGEKELAREQASATLTGEWPEHPALFVRVNGPASPWFDDDVLSLSALPATPRSLGVCIPKCETVDDVLRVHDALAAHRDLLLVPFIESAKGIVHAVEIAAAPSVVAVALGSEDLAADMGITRTKAGTEMAWYRTAVAVAARAANVQAIDAVFIDFGDPVGLLADAAAGRNAGFSGKQIIHPAQIDPVTRAYAPTADELAWASQVVTAFEDAEREGRGVVVVDGKMIDRPIVLQARALLRRRSAPRPE